MASNVGTIEAKLRVNAKGFQAGLKGAEKSLESFGTRMFFLGSRITAGVTLPIIGVTAAVLKMGAGFDQAMTESLAIISNVSQRMRAEMEATAKTVATTTKFSSEEAAQAYFFLASSGMNAAQAMAAMPVAANFAQAGVIGLEKATELLSDAYITLGLRSDDAAENMKNMEMVSDILTEANNRAQGTIEEFALALTNRAGVAFRVFGVSVQEGVAALAAFAERGIKGRTAGRQMFIVMRDLQKAASENAETWRELVGPGAVYDEATGEFNKLADILEMLEVTLDGKTDKVKKATLAMLGFQERSLQATLALVGASDRIRELERAFSRAGGVTKRVADKQMKSFTNQMTILAEKVKIVGIELFDSLQPAINDMLIPALKSAIKTVQDMGRWFKNLDTGTKSAIISWMGFVAALGPALVALGSLALLISGLTFAISPLLKILGFVAVPVMTALSGATGVAAMSMTGLGIAIKAALGPLGLILSVVGGLYIAFKTTESAFEGSTTNLEKFNAASGHTANELNDLKVAWLEARQEVMNTNRWTEEGTRATEALTDAKADLAFALGISTTQLDEQSVSLADSVTAIDDIINATHEMQQAAIAAAQVREDQAKAALEAEKESYAKALEAAQEWRTAQENMVFVPPTPGVQTEMGLYGGSPGTGPILTKNERGAGFFNMMADSTESLANAQRLYNEAVAEGAEAVKRYSGELEELRGTGTEGEELGLTPEEIAEQEEKLRRLTDEYKKYRDRIKDLRVEILGLESEEFKELKIAVDENIGSIEGNDKAMENLWGIYKKFRDGLAITSPLLDRLTGKFRRQEEALEFGKTAAGKFVMAMTNVERKYEDILTHQGRITMAFIEMNGQMSPRFFEEYGDELKILALNYGDRLEPAMRSIIDTYFETEIAAGHASAEMRRSQQQATQAMIEGSNKLNAELMDRRAELVVFSLDADDKELVGMKKGLEKRKLAHHKALVEMAKGLTFLTGAEYTAGVERLKNAKETTEEILSTEHRIGLLRIADALNVDREILRNHEEFTDAEIELIIKEHLAVQQMLDDTQKLFDVSRSVGSLVGLLGFDAAAESMAKMAGHAQNFAQSWANFKTGDFAQQLGALVGMASATIAVGKDMAGTKGRASRVGKGAMAGAQMGATFGPMGAAIGAGIGALAGLIMGDPGWAKIQDAVSTMWGVSVSDELAKQIEETSKEVGSDWGAMLLHLNDVINESGGVTTENVDNIVRHVRDAFSMIDMGIFTTVEAAEVLDENFAALAQTGTHMSGVIKANVLELMNLNDQFKTGSAAISEFKTLMVGEAVFGLNQFSDGVNTVMIGMRTGFETALAEAKEAFDKQKEENEDFEGNWEETAQTMRDDFKSEFTDAMLADFDDLQAFTAMTFLAMIGDGATFAEALNAVGPSLDVLKQGFHDMGIEGNESIMRLLRIREFQEVNKGIIKQVDGMNQLMLGLANSGLMTQSSFDQFGNTAQNQFKKMTDAGLGQNDALLLMAPTLQTLSDMADTYGFEIDANTQLLIDQAKEKGLLGDKAKTADDLMIEGLGRIADGIETLVNLLSGDLTKALEDAAAKAAEEAQATEDSYDDAQKEIQRGFDALTLPELKGHGSYNIEMDWPEFSPPTGREGESYASGGIISRPHMAMVGEGGEPEMIGPVSFMSKALEGALGKTGSTQIERETLNELHGLRSDLKTLPLHLRDAIILSG